MCIFEACAENFSRAREALDELPIPSVLGTELGDLVSERLGRTRVGHRVSTCAMVSVTICAARSAPFGLAMS